MTTCRAPYRRSRASNTAHADRCAWLLQFFFRLPMDAQLTQFDESLAAQFKEFTQHADGSTMLLRDLCALVEVGKLDTVAPAGRTARKFHLPLRTGRVTSG